MSSPSLINNHPLPSPTAFHPRFTAATCDELFTPDIMRRTDKLQGWSIFLMVIVGFTGLWHDVPRGPSAVALPPTPVQRCLSLIVNWYDGLCVPRANRPSKFVHISSPWNFDQEGIACSRGFIIKVAKFRMRNIFIQQYIIYIFIPIVVQTKRRKFDYWYVLLNWFDLSWWFKRVI